MLVRHRSPPRHLVHAWLTVSKAWHVDFLFVIIITFVLFIFILFHYDYYSVLGNVAAAHVCALRKLLSGKDEGLQKCGGLPMYVTDNTPPQNLPGLAQPFIQHLNLLPSRLLPYWMVYLMLMLTALWTAVWAVLGFASRPSSLPPLTLHRFCGTATVVSKMRAELCIGYSPPYSWSEAQRRANLYYCKKIT